MLAALFVFLLPLVGSAGETSLVCHGESLMLQVSSIRVGETSSQAFSSVITAQISVETSVDSKSFQAVGTREIMAAGYNDVLENKAEDFSFEEGFNGSMLNSWTMKPVVKYKGEELICQQSQ